MKKIFLYIAACLIVSCESNSSGNTNDHVIPTPVSINYSIVNIYPHDTGSFTQGLIWLNNNLYEGTGWVGESKLMKVDINTGKPVQQIDIPKELFGEGITIFNNKIYQLTWTDHKVFVYDLNTFKKSGEFTWNMEGWGLTNNDKHLIVSTGDSNLYFVNPETFVIEKTVSVYDNNGHLSNINELEYVNGKIYANIYNTNLIVRINPETGLVEGRMDFSNLLQKTNQPVTENTDVLNGIAFNAATNNFYITGKRWPALYEIKLN